VRIKGNKANSQEGEMYLILRGIEGKTLFGGEKWKKDRGWGEKSGGFATGVEAVPPQPGFYFEKTIQRGGKQGGTQGKASITK